MASWEEVSTAAKEKRHELVLLGKSVSDRIDDGGFDDGVYSLKHLNFLDISSTTLATLSPKVGDLSNLTNLVVRGNKITNVPESIGNLTKLKLLDLSGNKIESLPSELGTLGALQTLNANGNCISECPSLDGLGLLHILDLSNNQLESLPEGIFALEHLAQILVSGNSITGIPDEIADVQALKTFDISDNKLTAITPHLAECTKLKELKFGGNKLKDRRLGKMGEQCTPKSVLDYLRNILAKEQQQGSGKKKDAKKKKKGGKGGKSAIEELINKIEVLHFNDDSDMRVTISPAMAELRPYVVMCIVKNLDFNATSNMFKRFINLQTKLHEGVCEKRQAATIATHDLSLVKFPLRFEARSPSLIKIVPLFKMKEVSAEKLMTKLRHEADELRKEKKRNTTSGIHKYLDMLKGKPYYPVIEDKDGAVISFPPITNSDVTKVSKDTKDILIEVTSSLNWNICKQVMEELIRELLALGISATPYGGAAAEEEEEEAGAAAPVGALVYKPQHLVVEQVKVVDFDGGLKVVYPSRADLNDAAAFETIRA